MATPLDTRKSNLAHRGKRPFQWIRWLCDAIGGATRATARTQSVHRCVACHRPTALSGRDRVCTNPRCFSVGS